MFVTNQYSLPTPFVEAVRIANYARQPIDQQINHISCTRLIDSPRRVVLERRHSSELTEDVKYRLFSLLGMAIHYLLASTTAYDEADVRVEQRLSVEIDGWTVSGQYDRWERGCLSDYKVTTVYAVSDAPKREWIEQLNVLAYLCQKNDLQVNNLEIVLILRDWSAAQAERNDQYPQAPVITVPVKLWALEETEAFVQKRLALHKVAMTVTDEKLENCTEKERWCTPTSYAVMKPNRIRAFRVFDNAVDAECLASQTPSAHVVIRHGEPKRCQKYCAVNAFCSQYQDTLKHDQGAKQAALKVA